MKTIKINYSGWWKGFEPNKYIINQILNKNYNVIISDKPDYLFCSLFDTNFLNNEEAIRIFYTGENLAPDFNLFDYCIGFDELEFGDRYIRMPNYLMNQKYSRAIDLMKNKHKTYELQQVSQRKFCSFVVSNGQADSMRDYIFDKLSEYKLVSSGGRHRNNIGQPEGVRCKLDFQKEYKFALALENAAFPGYTTEKLVEAFAAGGIPIYWGDPNVGKYFNTKAFINIGDYSSLDKAIEEIKRIDFDDGLYRSYLDEPALVNQSYISDSIFAFELFLKNIIEQPIEEARRRPHNVWDKKIVEIVRKGTKVVDKASNKSLICKILGWENRR